MESISKFFRFGLNESPSINSSILEKGVHENLKSQTILVLEKKYRTENFDIRALVEAYLERKDDPSKIAETLSLNSPISDEEIFLTERGVKEDYERLQRENHQKYLNEGIELRMSSFGNLNSKFSIV